MTEDDDARSLISRAAQILRTGGWCQGDYSNYTTGEHCIVGALLAASTVEGQDAAYSRAKTLVRLAIGIYPDTGGSIPRWNDEPGRTVDEVLDALERAARWGMT